MPYALTLSLTSPKWRSALGSRPAPDTPLLASTTTSAMRPGAGERGQGEDRGRRVAAGRADDGVGLRARRRQLRPVQLRQAVDRRREQLGPRVVEVVPGRVVRGVAEPEVGPEVDDRLAAARGTRRSAPRPRRAAGRGTRPRRRRGPGRTRAGPRSRGAGGCRRGGRPAARARRGRRWRRAGGGRAAGSAPRRRSRWHRRSRRAPGRRRARAPAAAAVPGRGVGVERTVRRDRRARRVRAHGRAAPLAGGRLEGSEIGRHVVTA